MPSTPVTTRAPSSDSYPRPSSRHTLIVCLLLTLASLGCNNAPYDLAPVSGLVTLDAKPLAGATVKFAPDGPRDQALVGPGSMGKTDNHGRYRLRTFKDERGALVGRHRVTISTFEQRFIDLRKSDDVETTSEEQVPERYNRDTQLIFVVPAEGTVKADFALTSESS